MKTTMIIAALSAMVALHPPVKTYRVFVGSGGIGFWKTIP